MAPTSAVHDEIEPDLADLKTAVEEVGRKVDDLAVQMRESHAENKRKFEQILALLEKTPMQPRQQQPMPTAQYDEYGRVFVPETPGMNRSTPPPRRHTPKLQISGGTNLYDAVDGVPAQFAPMGADERAKLKALRAGLPSPISIGSLSVGASSSSAAREDLAKIAAAVVPFPDLQ